MLDIMLAVLLDWAVGDPRWFPHPVIYIGKLIKLLENFSRKYCKTQGTLRAAGALIVISVCVVSFVVPFTLIKLTVHIAITISAPAALNAP